MKTLAAISIGAYEKASQATDEYYQTIELGLTAILRQYPLASRAAPPRQAEAVGVVVFGSDLGMVGPFNDHLLPLVLEQLQGAARSTLWPVGERIAVKLQERLAVEEKHRVPDAVHAINDLVGRLVLEIASHQEVGDLSRLMVVYNRPLSAASYQPAAEQLLPLDPRWLGDLGRQPWPTPRVPQVLPAAAAALQSFLEEHLFLSLCRACAASLVSENISRLLAMQRAEENITALLQLLQREYNQARQGAITAELFDIVFGYDTLERRRKGQR